METGKVCAVAQGSTGALSSCAHASAVRVESSQGTSRLQEEAASLSPSLPARGAERTRKKLPSGTDIASLGFWTLLHFGLCCILSLIS